MNLVKSSNPDLTWRKLRLMDLNAKGRYIELFKIDPESPKYDDGVCMQKFVVKSKAGPEGTIVVESDTNTTHVLSPQKKKKKLLTVPCSWLRRIKDIKDSTPIKEPCWKRGDILFWKKKNSKVEVTTAGTVIEIQQEGKPIVEAIVSDVRFVDGEHDGAISSQVKHDELTLVKDDVDVNICMGVRRLVELYHSNYQQNKPRVTKCENNSASANESIK